MNKKSLLNILFSFFMLAVYAEESDSLSSITLNSFEMIKVTNPWLGTSNPAGLHFNNGFLPGKINFFYGMENGDYKRIQQGENINYYSFQSMSYSKIKDINLFGSFSYDKSYENDLDFSNTNNPYRGTPYDMIDTIGGDTYNREFFYLNGVISKPLGKSTILGLGVDFGVGVSVQENDPRPENKVLDILVTPGIIHSLSKIKLGINFIYQYYNEEIEIDIIEDNATATMFRTLGLGVYSFHEAGSFNRLYKRNSYGGDVQINYSTEKLNVIVGAKGIYFRETVEDGGKGGDASWNYMRNYSRFEGIDWNIYSNIRIKKDLLIHNINLKVNYLTTQGTEIIENLEQVGELDNEDWVFYMDEPKYRSELTNAKLNYDFIKMKNSIQPNYGFSINGNYYAFEQGYYVPFQKEKYDHALFGLEASKMFKISKSLLSLTVGLDYKMNISGEQSFEKTNFLYDKLLLPDFQYLTGDYYAPVLNLSYELPLNNLFNKIFFDAKTKLLIGENGQSRTIADFSIGVIF